MPTETRPRYRRLRIAARIVLPTLTLAVAGVTAWLAFQPALRLRPLPIPNGYDDIKLAGTKIVGQEPGPKGDVWVADEAGLRVFVTANQAALALGRAGLAKECQVPLSVEKGTLDRQIADHVTWTSGIRRLARLMVCEARLARIEERKEDALRIALEIVQLGQHTGRGGMMLDYYAGQAITSQGLRLLYRDRERLTTAELQHAVRRLETIDTNREPLSEMFSREKSLGKVMGVWQVRMAATFTSTFDSQLKPALDAAEFSEKRTATNFQLLLGDFGLRIYQQTHGKLPNSLAELAPNPLARQPYDPFLPHRRPLVYRKESPGAMLYSVGPDRFDDGGKPITKLLPDAKGDVTLQD